MMSMLDVVDPDLVRLDMKINRQASVDCLAELKNRNTKATAQTAHEIIGKEQR